MDDAGVTGGSATGCLSLESAGLRFASGRPTRVGRREVRSRLRPSGTLEVAIDDP
ncbi:hypothetical protein J2751_001139 [Halorubrum alkaliphilum]|uniref:Uncharacterized protein n=1 Tax=Halorubrum alkaliphilum TaxID=261290 RepID=A0A8T4GCE7_9EURY|nr:hypothetical protein [Halorubrum alkaliphilum]